MEYLIYIAIGFVAAILVLLVYIRVAPNDASVLNAPKIPVMGPGDYPSVSGHLVQRPLRGGGRLVLERLDQIIMDTQRTKRIAGSLEDNKMTYETRSKLIGFPDFTTVTLTPIPATGGSTLQVYGRLRFGKSDLGVNRKRIQGWMAQLDAKGGTATPHP